MTAKSANSKSGGTTAEPSNPDNPMKPTDTTPVTLKKAAAMFGCASSSLKNNIKTGNLPGMKAGVKAPFMVHPSDVERFLRSTPGIASNFHPAKGKTHESKILTSQARVPGDEFLKAPESKACEESPLPALPAKKSEPAKDPQKTESSPPNVAPPIASAGEDHATQPHPKRRRRRRRGKGGKVEAPRDPGSEPLTLKALAGTTPQERLRLTACLNELASLVASS